MSSPEQARPVWLTREQMMAIYDKSEDALDDLWAAWDAAPWDAAEAVAEVLYGRSQAMPLAVLRALGMPSPASTPNQDATSGPQSVITPTTSSLIGGNDVVQHKGTAQ